MRSLIIIFTGLNPWQHPEPVSVFLTHFTGVVLNSSQISVTDVLLDEADKLLFFSG